MDARAFATDWVEAWNTRDLERVLSHYAPDIELTSPTALRVVPESGGIVVGIDALRAYWTKALSGNTTLRFRLIEVLETVSGCTILYRNQKEQLVTESFFWNAEGRVVRSSAAYSRLPLETESSKQELYCLIARIPPTGVLVFQSYEEEVLPLLREHGAALERRVRSTDHQTEVHLVRFPSEAALESYRSDPRRAAAEAKLVSSGAKSELVRVDDVSF